MEFLDARLCLSLLFMSFSGFTKRASMYVVAKHADSSFIDCCIQLSMFLFHEHADSFCKSRRKHMK